MSGNPFKFFKKIHGDFLPACLDPGNKLLAIPHELSKLFLGHRCSFSALFHLFNQGTIKSIKFNDLGLPNFFPFFPQLF